MFDLVLRSAILGAHIQKPESGFRQRDVRFLMDLSWNWQSTPLRRAQLERVHNTQIQRSLRSLVGDTWAQAASRQGPPRYRLTRAGFLGLVRQLREHAVCHGIDEFLFVRYFFASYRGRIEMLVEKSGAPMPLSFRQELAELLDLGKLLQSKTSNLEKEVAYWDLRVRENLDSVAHVKKELRRGTPWGEIVAQVERAFPYELNYQKPLTQLLRETPEDIQRWELLEGSRLRVELLWAPQRAELQAQLSQLAKLSAITA